MNTHKPSVPIRVNSCSFVAVLLFLSGDANGQTDSRPAFEVASIKRSSLNIPGGSLRTMPGGRLTVTNLTLNELIAHAWNIQPYQISGGPAWGSSARYNITAKAEKSVRWEEAAQMLRSLLADRFQLTMHRETKELPIYALVLAKKDGKLGPGLTESKDGSCKVADATTAIPTRPEPGKPALPLCHTVRSSSRFLAAVGFPLSDFARSLSEILGRDVVDQTGLVGAFDISMEWTPDEIQYLQLPPGVPAPPPSESPVSIFTSIQERLGLKLESRKGPVGIFVIDRAEKPTEN
jgi:uncharacterized protein (TIGR03435 family)